MTSYTIEPDTGNRRFVRLSLSERCQRAFISASSNISLQEAEYVPFQRFRLASTLSNIVGSSLAVDVRSALHNRSLGAVLIDGFSDVEIEEHIKFSTAISHLVGVANNDQMSGKFYARFSVRDADNSDTYLRQAYRPLTLHTDGTYVEEQTDWVLMMKLRNENSVGGRSRLLHLDDWQDLDHFTQHGMAGQKFLYQAPPSKNTTQPVRRRLFTQYEDGWGLSFIDQFVHPETVEQAQYLWELSDSLESSVETIDLDLNVGEMVVINNRFWLHGRTAFQPKPDLHRELLRQRGRFEAP